MFPWAALIGLAGQAVSGIASARNNARTQEVADAEAARQQAYYNARAKENPLSRADNQALLRSYDRKAQQTAERARNTATILGQTPEQQLATQKQLIEGRADLMSGMAAASAERADKYTDMAEQAHHQKVLDDQSRRATRNQTYANLAANAASAAGSMLAGYNPKGIADYQSELKSLDEAYKAGSINKDVYNSAKEKINSNIQSYWDKYR